MLQDRGRGEAIRRFQKQSRSEVANLVSSGIWVPSQNPPQLLPCKRGLLPPALGSQQNTPLLPLQSFPSSSASRISAALKLFLVILFVWLTFWLVWDQLCYQVSVDVTFHLGLLNVVTLAFALKLLSTEQSSIMFKTKGGKKARWNKLYISHFKINCVGFFFLNKDELGAACLM